MVGGHVLDLCLSNELITEIVNLVRRPTGKQHPKLKEIILQDFLDYSSIEDQFTGTDIVLCCMGVYTGTVSKEVFRKVTVDYPVALANTIFKYAPEATFCYLSGAGADRSEKSRTLFARQKGIAENTLAQIGFKSFHTFRPGYIYPSIKRKEPNLGYSISRALYPVIKLFGPKFSITSKQLAQGMFNVGLNSCELEVLENKDILGQL